MPNDKTPTTIHRSAHGRLHQVDLGADDKGHFPVLILDQADGTRRAVEVRDPAAIRQLASKAPHLGDTVTANNFGVSVSQAPVPYGFSAGDLPEAADWAGIGNAGYHRGQAGDRYIVAPKVPGPSAPEPDRGPRVVRTTDPSGRVVSVMEFPEEQKPTRYVDADTGEPA